MLCTVLEQDINKQTTIMYKINELQGYIVQHREYSQYFIIMVIEYDL